MATDPARRALTRAGRKLTAAGFVRRIWPAGPAHVYEHITRHHRITVVLRRDHGHQPDGTPYDIPTAVQHALELAQQERISAA